LLKFSIFVSVVLAYSIIKTNAKLRKVQRIAKKVEFNGINWNVKNNKNTNYSHEPLVSEIHNIYETPQMRSKEKPL